MFRNRIFGAAVFLFVVALPVQSQVGLPPEVARHGFADTIVINGKVVSMDDAGLNENPGNIYEAMAIKGNRIVALGTTQRIRALADSNTKVFDAQGQLVIPGIIQTHSHLFGADGAQLGLPTPNQGINIRVQASKDVESTRLAIENSIQEAVQKVNPGDWILVGVTPNRQEDVTSNRIVAWFAAEKLETKDRLDRVAPDNPVVVQGGIRGAINSKAMEMATAAMPYYPEFINNSTGDKDASMSGEVGSQEMGALTYEIFYKGKPMSLIAELFRRHLERAAANGTTTFSSRVPHPLVLSGFALLNREGKMPIRFQPLFEVHRRPEDPVLTRKIYQLTGNMTGMGNDYLWFGGVASERWDTSFPMACLGADVEAPPRIKARELCLEPGDMFWDTLQNALEAGWRLAGIHGLGSDGVRRFMRMVEMARVNSGMTVEDIQKLRLTVEHAPVLGQVPDVMANLKKYGIIVSVAPGRIVRYHDYIKDYGPAITPFMLPVKTWLAQGIKVVGQDGATGGLGNLFVTLMTRIVDGQVVGPDERIERVTVLKMYTRWAAEYVMKENDLGSLEVGKFADFVVLDKDYFAIPVEEIPNITPQMTVVGGRIAYLGTGYAGRLGMEPVGYQFAADAHPWAGGGGGD
ncbi:MAG: amidohydrolase family protein [Acidobacteria bacterium]|nr:amidohydrolase family protein [Acidobacteriota bacterium]